MNVPFETLNVSNGTFMTCWCARDDRVGPVLDRILDGVFGGWLSSRVAASRPDNVVTVAEGNTLGCVEHWGC
ncbi:hypothetical protein BC739_009219 [Kutzneria viridogrisea]|uniref:Uncharacterized protein n=1 Tax=Kutzneria viridogrisea TaxID=47990 RepID=A0ABR6BYH4_9PSEU|nr:hypothetical protein [Kutzneria albida]MBA8931960.1 hypothetical protein [Kutzneria viridogrisea]